MKKLFFTILVLLAVFQISFATADSVKFILLRMDYLTYQPKHLYYFQQQYNISIPAEHEKIYHDLYVTINPAIDFGGTKIRGATTGNIVYEATTVWMGTGQHLFPPPAFEINPGFNVIEPQPRFLDIENRFFDQADSARADSAWQIAAKYIPLILFGGDSYGALIYLHYFTVGLGDPTTAEWIIIYYALPDSYIGRWTNISGDLPNLHINSIAPHPFFTDSLFIGTDAGAFQTSDSGKHWNKIKFSENSDIPITQVRAEMHPYLDWTVPVLWLGTEERTMIPEDRLGCIFFSADGGLNWINTYFPRITVSALDVPKDSSLVAFAAAYNPFYYLDSFFAMDDTGWVEYDLTPGDTTTMRINCIEVDENSPGHWFLATSNGLSITTDWGINWTKSGANWNCPWAVIPHQQPAMLYAILFGGSRSEGIYRSKDAGQNWERACWTVNAVTFLPDYSTPGIWFKAIKNLGVYKSSDDCSTWTDISSSLPEKDILCLAQDRRNPSILYAGTTNGIFRYDETASSVYMSEENMIRNTPQNFELITAYPNPFNSNVQIRYQVSMNSTRVKIELYNMLGQRIKVLVDNIQSCGDYLAQWDGRDQTGKMLPSGIYFCRLQLNQEPVKTLKLLLIQ